eukprot:scaffold12849_cov146-Isochrysis_galbana.AAC.2
MKKDDLLRALFLLLLPIHIHLSQCASSFLILIAGKNQPCANREQSAAQPLTTTHGSMSVAAQQVVHDITTRHMRQLAARHHRGSAWGHRLRLTAASEFLKLVRITSSSASHKLMALCTACTGPGSSERVCTFTYRGIGTRNASHSAMGRV